MKSVAPVSLLLAFVTQVSLAHADVAAPDTVKKPVASAKQVQVAQAQQQVRQRPGKKKSYPPPIEQNNEGAVWAPPPEAFPTDQIPVPDRWRLIDELEGTPIANWYDPYNQNSLKADRPIEGYQDWFFNLSAISDTVVEPRAFPLPTGIQTT